MYEIALFSGFSEPLENWSKLPHSLIEALPLIKSLSELKIVLYILRHTWGYKEFDSFKAITTDEFAHGRKKKDGSRIDSGVGMSEPSIRSAIKLAIKHGFIHVEVDKTDLARVEKSYQLNIQGSKGVKSLPPEGKEFTIGGKEVNPRSEKDTLDKKPKKDSADAPVSFQSPNPSNTNTSHSNAIKGSSLNGTKKRSEKSPRKKKLTALEQAKLDMQPFREVVHQMAVMCKAGYDVMGDIDHSLSIPEMTDYTLHASEYMRLGGRAEDVKDIYEYIASDETRTANIAPVSIVKGLLGWKAAQKAIENEKKIDQAYEEAKAHVETLMTDEQRKKRAEQMKADRIAIFGEKTA